MAWRKMETAPKDGSQFLAKDSLDQPVIVFWKSKNEYGYSGFAYNYGWFNYVFVENLTGWQPCPR